MRHNRATFGSADILSARAGWQPALRRLGLPALALLAASSAALAAPQDALTPKAPPPIVQIGSAYFAKQLCSCLFVVGRSEASCRAEFKPRIDIFKIVIDRSALPQSATVSAALGPVSAVARFDPRYGCVLVK